MLVMRFTDAMTCASEFLLHFAVQYNIFVFSNITDLLSAHWSLDQHCTEILFAHWSPDPRDTGRYEE